MAAPGGSFRNPSLLLALWLCSALAFYSVHGEDSRRFWIEKDAFWKGEDSRRFWIEKDAFWKDGEQFQIVGGDVHYFRIVPEFLESRHSAPGPNQGSPRRRCRPAEAKARCRSL